MTEAEEMAEAGETANMAEVAGMMGRNVAGD